MPIQDFFAGTSKKFDVRIRYNNSYPDLTSDDVIFYLKDNKTDSDYVLTASADVSESGENGYAKFNLEPNLTKDLNPENYWYEIVWKKVSSGEEYVLDQNTIAIKARI